MSLTTVSGVAGAQLTRSLKETSAAAMELATSSGMLAAAIMIPLGLATKAAMDFEKQMGNVNTLVDGTKENIGLLSDQVLELASKTPVPIHDLTESLYQLYSEGYKGAQAMDLLKESAHLAVSGLSTATEATKSMATAVRVFEDEHLSAHEIADTFFKTVAAGRTTMAQINEAFGENAAIVHTAGVSFKEFQAATAAMTNGGLTAATAQTNLAQATLALTKPSTEMMKIFSYMGYYGSEAGRNIIKAKGGIVPAMQAINEAATRTGESIEKAFGRKQGLIANELLTGMLNGQYVQDMKRMSDGIEEVSEAYRKQLGTTAAQSQIAKNNLVTLGIRIGEILLPALTKLFQVFDAIVTPIANFIHQHKVLGGIIVWGTAILGGFFTLLTGGALVIYAVTKATMIWKTAIGLLTISEKLAALQTAFFSASIYTQLGLIGLLAGAIAFLLPTFFDFNKMFGIGNDKLGLMNDNLDGANDRFHKIKEPINQATIAMLAYNDAVDKYNEQQRQRALDDYNTKMHPVASYFKDLFTPKDWRVMSPEVIPVHPDTAARPSFKDFLPVGVDTTRTPIQPEYLGNGFSGQLPQYNEPGKEQKVSLLIENKTGNSISATATDGPIVPTIKPTASYNTRTT